MRKTESVVVMRRRKEAKIASPCKDAYVSVVPVQLFRPLCCVSSPVCGSVSL